jgi:phosphoglycerol transferase
MQPNEMAETLVLAGFSGIYLNRDGYAERGVALQRDLTSLLEREPMVSQNQQLLFFALDKMEDKLRRKYPGEAWQVRRRLALLPLQGN